MKFSPINTARLSIRRLNASDANTLSRYRSIPEVARFQSWTEYSVQQAQELILQIDKSSPDVKGEWFQFGIELNATGELIGDIGFLNTDELGKSWLGFTLDSKYWKQGLAIEAVAAVLAFYTNIGISTFWASTDPTNIASQNLLEKLGFVLFENKPDDSIYKKTTF
jgi:RimJ/RimL family protein N-acetyltransferase